MNILIASSEVTPFAKTGGLADVCGALPIELAKLGIRPTVMLPAYRPDDSYDLSITPTNITLDIPIGDRVVSGRLLESRLPGSDVRVYLVEQNDYYDREQLYTDGDNDYPDNCERFIFFCRAVVESIRRLELPVDVLHCNDWQTGLIPAYLKIEHAHTPGYENIGSLMTLHNMAHQGTFLYLDMPLTGLDWKFYNWRQMEFYDQLSFLKTGLVFSDSINTVSPTYAQEIQRSPLGCGLDGVLKERSDVLSGIINGIDDRIWNPATDSHLPANYSATKCKDGKAECKAALQREVGLPESADTPLLGLIGRLAEQKGWDLIVEVMRQWIRTVDAQWVILGTGQTKYEELLEELALEDPTKVAVTLGFSDPLAHRIEAGADIFVMASEFEPCGLNQLYSLRYGTIPVVHSTGGLADTISDATPDNLANGTANGFAFKKFDAESLDRALRAACDVYRNQRKVWRQLVRTGMRQDWSWTKSAQQYIKLYEKTVERRKASLDAT